MLLYFLLAVFLILDFLILNNNPLHFYLLTLLIIPFLFVYPKYTKQVLSVMLGFVITGSALYLTFSAATILSLPLNRIGNNFNVLGYYLLTDCLIAIVIYAVIQNYSLEPKIKKIKKFVQHNSAALTYLLFIIALVLMIGPFWPVSQTYQTYINQTVVSSYNAILTRSYNQSASSVTPTNYVIIPVCSSGSNTTFVVTFSANRPAIEFYMQDYSGLADIGIAKFQEDDNYIETDASGVTSLGTKGSLNFSTSACAQNSAS